MSRYVLLLVTVCTLGAEVRTLTLREALDLALRQNPEITLARLDEQKAVEGVRLAKDPFVTRITVGSGLAYSNGYPMSIEGSGPSIVHASAQQYLFNRQQSYAVAKAKEDARSASFGTAASKDEAVFRTACLYLDAERAARLRTTALHDIESLEKVLKAVEAAVAEGRELPLAAKKAALNLARARQVATNLAAEQEAAETALAQVLGFPADERARAAGEQRRPPAMPPNEDESVQAAVRGSAELKRLESQLVARGLEIRGFRAARLPRIDLVAQYGLYSRYNNYDEYFRKFQRNNGQVGISIQLPVLPGPGISAQTSQTQAEIARLRTQMNLTRSRISNDVRQAYRDLRKAESAAEVARLDLDVAREQLSVMLALMDEGRATLRQVEETRLTENDKWMTLYDAQYAIERARWAILRQTGELAAALR